MRKQESYTVEGSDGPVTVILTQLDGNRALTLATKLARLMAGAAGSATLPAGADAEAAKAANAQLAKIISAVVSNLSDADFQWLKNELFLGGQVQTSSEVLDLNSQAIGEVFAGHPGSVLRLMFEGVKLNAGNFLQDLGISTAAGVKAKGQVLKLPKD